MFSLQFLLTSLVVALIPGTGVIYTVSVGLVQGRRASVFASLGCTAGILPHLAATVLGLAALMQAGALAFAILKYAGAVYLLHVAVATWRDRSVFACARTAQRRSAFGIAQKALLLNILNPKLTLFFFAFLPQFVRPGAGRPLLQLVGLSLVFMLVTLVVFIGYGFLAHAFRARVIDAPRVQAWLRRGFAASFAALGVDLALSER